MKTTRIGRFFASDYGRFFSLASVAALFVLLLIVVVQARRAPARQAADVVAPARSSTPPESSHSTTRSTLSRQRVTGNVYQAALRRTTNGSAGRSPDGKGHAAASEPNAGLTYYVDRSGSNANTCLTPADPCRTIQEAVDRAGGGDTVRIGPGTYAELVTIEKRLMLIGAGAGSTVIDGKRLDAVVYVDATATISGTTIQNGAAEAGGGIFNDLNANLTLNHSIIRNSHAISEGGGIYNSGILTLNDTRVVSNSAGQFGGGISTYEGRTRLNHSDVVRNSSGDTGGGIDSFSSTVTVNQSTLRDNNAEQVGGAMNGFESTIVLIDSDVTGNQAGSDGGGILLHTGTLELTRSRVRDNGSAYYGGGIATINAMTRINGSTFLNNSAEQTITDTVGGGGALDVYDGVLHVRGSHFQDNSAGLVGGAINIEAGTLAITDTDILSNTTTGWGGGIATLDSDCFLRQLRMRYNVADYAGGAIELEGDCVIRDSTLAFNSAEFGGAVEAFSGTITIATSTLHDNDAGYGGGIDISTADVSIVESVIRNNYAFLGGGIENFEEGKLSLLRTTVSDNIAEEYGGGLYNEAISTLGGSMTVRDSTITGNRAAAAGGIGSGGLLTIVDSRVTTNTATLGIGGGIAVVSDTTTLERNVISGNGMGLYLDTATFTSTLGLVATENTFSHNTIAGIYITGTLPLSATIGGAVGRGNILSDNGQNILVASLPPGSTINSRFNIDDEVTVRLAAADAGIAEDAGSATITVTLNKEQGAAVTVDYATRDGTATAGSDYTAITGTLTFLPGETSKSLAIPITGDSADEVDETLQLTLSSATNAVLTGPSTITVTIVDDDQPPVYAIYLPLVRVSR
jgi:hypothetical protein